MTDKHVTISDIAKIAGVSKTTISRFLNGNFGYMSRETKERIQSVIESENYTPSSIARTLKARKSYVIAVIANTLQYQVAAQTINAIVEVCSEHGYSVHIYCSNDDPVREDRDIESCLSMQVDGFIIFPAVNDASRYEKIRQRGIPVVLCTRYLKEWKYGSVYVNHEALVDRMMGHLKEQGFEKVLFLLDEETYHKKRHKGAFLFSAVKLFGMPEEGSWAVVGRDEGRCTAAIEAFANRYPDEKKAVFAINTNTLFNTLKALRALGKRIPEDFGVCGYDVQGWSELVTPGISAVFQPMNRIGELSGRLLMKQLNHEEGGEEQIALDGEIYFRPSTQLRQ